MLNACRFVTGGHAIKIAEGQNSHSSLTSDGLIQLKVRQIRGINFQHGQFKARIGTLEELFEAWTWGQLGVHDKPCALLNIDGFFDQLIGFLDMIRDQSFLMPTHRDMLIVKNDPEELLDAFAAYEHPVTEKWISEENI